MGNGAFHGRSRCSEPRPDDLGPAGSRSFATERQARNNSVLDIGLKLSSESSNRTIPGNGGKYYPSRCTERSFRCAWLRDAQVINPCRRCRIHICEPCAYENAPHAKSVDVAALSRCLRFVVVLQCSSSRNSGIIHTMYPLAKSINRSGRPHSVGIATLLYSTRMPYFPFVRMFS